MKRIYPILILTLFVVNIFGQDKIIQLNKFDTYFKEVAKATKKGKKVWNIDLYGPILLINTETREIYANKQDSLKTLKLAGNIYTGIFPKDQHISNTSIHWNGTDWATVMLPLPENKYDLISLLSHELFHVKQPELGFTLNNDESRHLDTKDGRVYLRLELEALKKAISSSGKSEILQHLRSAFIFRKYRQSLFPEAGTKENELELNEGMAEYTGESISGRSVKEKPSHFINNIDRFFENPTFVRSFAYQTIPAYGYLLDKSQSGWNKKIKKDTDLTDFFIDAFKIVIPNDLKDTAILLSENYNGRMIIDQEIKREEETGKRIAEYKQKFVEEPHFEISFEKMLINFDPRNIIPLEDYGTIYPSISVIDLWGILHVTKGALMNSNWDKIIITNPTDMNNNELSGDGWSLVLNKGYSINIINGNFFVKKND